MTASAPNDEPLNRETMELLERYGFDRGAFDSFRKQLAQGEPANAHNRILGLVEPPAPEDISRLPPVGSPERKALHERGSAAIRVGKVAAVVLAGGMATRFGGVVKAAVEVADGKNFLELKLADIRACAKRAGGVVPTFLMTSFATDAEVGQLAKKLSSAEAPTETFPQFISLRLNADGSLFHDAQGEASPYAPGHGDLPFALRRAGLIARMQQQGIAHIVMSNVDNLAATLDPAILGAHIQGGKPMSVEVADKAPGDKGGAPARVNGSLQVVEGFRFPKDFDQDAIPVFNTNTFVIDVAALDRDFELSWFGVIKKVDAKTAIQFERLVGELTAHLPSLMIGVERDGEHGRFMPVKDPPELEARRESIMAALKARGAL